MTNNVNNANNGRPRVPGTEYEGQPTIRRQCASTQQAQGRNTNPYNDENPQVGNRAEMRPQPQPREPKAGVGGTWKGVIGGAVAGGVVSAALVAALVGTGVLSVNTGLLKLGSGSGSNGSSGQTINIATASEDNTTDEVVAAKCLPSVVSISVETPEGSGIGSGVVLDTEGNIITNWHVAGDATSIKVTIEGNTYDATLVGGDSSSDIAVIKADLNGAIVTPIEVGDSSELVVGDWVMTLGSPLGLDQSASSGIVSALYRNQLMAGTSGNTVYTNLIQVDAAINGGNSGGALVNEKGQLVGINTLYANASGTESFSGIGFAIPGNYAVDIANKVINGEQVTHAYIGVSCSTVNEQNAKSNHLSVDSGAYIAEIAENGPAAAAGLQVGDIVTKIGDNKVDSADGLILAVRSCAVGDTVDVTYIRNGKEETAKVTLGSDEALQAQQEEQQKQQQEMLEQQYQQYQQYQQSPQQYQQYQQYPQQQQQQQQQNTQTWPWDTYEFPW